MLLRVIHLYIHALSNPAHTSISQNLVQNMLVNGSVGKVIGYSTAADVVRERKSGNNKIYVAVPLHLAPLTGREFIRQKDRDAAQAQLNRWVYDKRSWPIVRFYRGRSRDRTVDILCVPQLFVVANPTGGIAAFREQVGGANTAVSETTDHGIRPGAASACVRAHRA